MGGDTAWGDVGRLQLPLSLSPHPGTRGTDGARGPAGREGCQGERGLPKNPPSKILGAGAAPPTHTPCAGVPAPPALSSCPQGQAGTEGPPGKMGPVGAQGAPGRPGPEGLRGIPGPAVSGGTFPVSPKPQLGDAPLGTSGVLGGPLSHTGSLPGRTRLAGGSGPSGTPRSPGKSGWARWGHPGDPSWGRCGVRDTLPGALAGSRGFARPQGRPRPQRRQGERG